MSSFRRELKSLCAAYFSEIHKLAEVYRQNRVAAAEIKDFHSAVLKQKSKKIIDAFNEIDLKYGEEFKQLMTRYSGLQELQKRKLLLTELSQFHQRAQTDLQVLKDAAGYLLTDAKARALSLPDEDKLQRLVRCTYEMIADEWITRF